jgi:multiple sugar transport system permease protein
MKKRRPTRIITYIGVLLLAFFILAPLVWLVISSVIPEEAILKFPPAWFGLGITNDNYVYIFTGQIPQSHLTSGQMRTMISQEVRLVPRAIGNSLLVAGGVMIINLIAGSLAAYAYARLRFPARRTTFFFITLSRLIPPVALAVPYYTIVQKLGLLDTYWSLIAVYSVLTLPFSVLILTLYFRGIPREIEEAAEIDGCDPFQILWRVTIPLALPSLVGTGLFAFMLSYSEFLFALLITTSIKTRTLPVILGSVSWNPDVTWSLLSASIVLGLIPTMLLVVPVWRFMVTGLAAGASR